MVLRLCVVLDSPRRPSHIENPYSPLFHKLSTRFSTTTSEAYIAINEIRGNGFEKEHGELHGGVWKMEGERGNDIIKW